MKKNKKGFTLIELLIAVSIIGLLAAISVVAFNSIRIKSRDARRMADIKQIQATLQMYYMDHHLYPIGEIGTNTVLADNGFSANPSGEIYLSKVPTNPAPANEGLCTGGLPYVYTQKDDGASYTLSYCHSVNGPTIVTPSSNR